MPGNDQEQFGEVRNLRLPRLTDMVLLKVLRKMDTQENLKVTPVTCFWIGSVSSAKPAELNLFVSLAKNGNLEELVKFDYVGNDIAFAVAAQDIRSAVNYHVFVFRYGVDLYDGLECLHASALPQPYAITPEVETASGPSPSDFKWWHFLTEMALPGLGTRLYRRSRDKKKRT